MLVAFTAVPKFSSGIGSPGWSRKKGRKAVVVLGYAVSLAASECVFFSVLNKMHDRDFFVVHIYR